MPALASSLTLQPATEADLGFLKDLYATTRDQEMQMVPWTDEQKRQFLDMQFHAQHTFYHDAYPGSSFDIILLDGQPIGRLYVYRSESVYNILDIAIMPEWRGQGIGTYYMHSVMDEAAASGRPVAIHVEFYNPAQRLYDRLGFRRIEEVGVHYAMQWDPPTVSLSSQ